MIDKKTEADIKALKSFLEFWTKFRSIYDEAVSRDIISGEDEVKFLEIRDTIKAKYAEVASSLEFKYAPHSRLTDPVASVLAISSIRLMSERSLKKLNEDWRDSYVFLNSVMEHLKNKKKRLEDFNSIAVFIKRFFDRKGELKIAKESK